jgi:F-type H+-transporting ATPase subunit epsilon
MADALNVRLVSVHETVYEGAARSVVFPAWDGQVGILPGHAPMIALLGAGELTISLPGGGEDKFYLAQGVMRVEEDEVTILTEYVGPSIPEDFLPSPMWPDPKDPAGGMGYPGNPLV